MLADLIEGGEIGDTLPEAARPMFAMMIDMLTVLDGGSANWTRRSRVVLARTRWRAG
jgi:hypothetical protein